MNNYYLTFLIILITTSVWVSNVKAQTNAPFSCVTNGRFADLTDPCGQAYTVCLWVGSQFLMWKTKCPNQLVFLQTTSKCVVPTTSLPSSCLSGVPTQTTLSTTSTTVSSVPSTTTKAPFSCVMNGRFADTSDSCGQTYILCSWDGTKFLSWTLKCPDQFVFYQITSECVLSTTPIPSTCLPTTTQPTTVSTTPAGFSCTMNGRFADPSDSCGQAYILCSSTGSQFLMTRLKCPNKLVFNQVTSKCVQSTTPLPSTC